MSLEELKKRYFWLAANDPTNKTEPEPATFDGNSDIKPLIDMKEYMGTLIASIKNVKKGDFLYISGWLFSWIGAYPSSFFGIDLNTAGPGQKKFTDLLIEKAKAGVDVRVLGWVSASAMVNNPADGHPTIEDHKMRRHPRFIIQEKFTYSGLNAITMNSMRILRKEPKMAKHAMLNLLGHPVGSVHTKMVVLGDTQNATGFTGGLDLSQWRWAEYGHSYPPSKSLSNLDESLDWHDVQAMVKGKAVQALYDFFRDMWNENLKRRRRKFLLTGKSAKLSVRLSTHKSRKGHTEGTKS